MFTPPRQASPSPQSATAWKVRGRGDVWHCPAAFPVASTVQVLPATATVAGAASRPEPQTKAADLRGELETRKQLLLALEQQNEKLQQLLSEMDRDKVDLSRALQDSRQECAMLRRERDGQEQQIQRLQSSLEAASTSQDTVRQLTEKNAEQAERIEELEGALRSVRVRDAALNEPAPPPQPTADDVITARLQEYFVEHPDFHLDIEQVGPGWYNFGKPISKKVFLKVAGKKIVARVGGGSKEFCAWLDSFRMSTSTGFRAHR